MTRPHGRASNAPLEMPALRSGRELLKKAHEHGGRLGPGGICEKMKILPFCFPKQKRPETEVSGLFHSLELVEISGIEPLTS